eukprot:gene37650-23309_t
MYTKAPTHEQHVNGVRALCGRTCIKWLRRKEKEGVPHTLSGCTRRQCSFLHACPDKNEDYSPFGHPKDEPPKFREGDYEKLHEDCFDADVGLWRTGLIWPNACVNYRDGNRPNGEPWCPFGSHDMGKYDITRADCISEAIAPDGLSICLPRGASRPKDVNNRNNAGGKGKALTSIEDEMKEVCGGVARFCAPGC